MKESNLLARATSTLAEARLVRLAQARQGLIAVADTLKEAGLTNGVVLFSECSDSGDLYALDVMVKKTGEGMSKEQIEKTLEGCVDLRDFADALTNAGHGEFFALTIDFARFREEYIDPLERELCAAGVEMDA